MTKRLLVIKARQGQETGRLPGGHAADELVTRFMGCQIDADMDSGILPVANAGFVALGVAGDLSGPGGRILILEQKYFRPVIQPVGEGMDRVRLIGDGSSACRDANR